MAKILNAYLAGKHIGHLEQSRDRLVFTYLDSWLTDPNAFPLSLSLPLTTGSHKGRAVTTYLKGLLPENPEVIRGWERYYQTSFSSLYNAMYHVGADLPGAIQFIRPDHVDALDSWSLVPLTDSDVADLITDAISGRAAFAGTALPGSVSLAGVQSKFALHRSVAGQWFIPKGRSASTHIFKPAANAYPNIQELELVSMQAAAMLGISVAECQIMSFDTTSCYVATRFDRVWDQTGRLQRIHQEDICQALGIPPERKYASDGGPSVTATIKLLAQATTGNDSIARYLAQLAYNAAICGTDAHGKNYALLHAAKNSTLAPTYDTISLAGFPNFTRRLAQHIGGEGDPVKVTIKHWRRLAERTGLDPQWVLSIVAPIYKNAADALTTIATRHDYRQLPEIKAAINFANKQSNREWVTAHQRVSVMTAAYPQPLAPSGRHDCEDRSQNPTLTMPACDVSKACDELEL